MPDFYYQIKGRKADSYGGSYWHWPPLVAGKVTAKDKKEARTLINDMHEREFPLRVKREDRDKNPFLLNLREIMPDDKRTIELFEEKTCPQCDSRFRLIDIYNDDHNHPGGREFCSHLCKSAHAERHRAFDPSSEENARHAAFIYRIYNIKEDKCYIGQTRQAFTLRWYQHFYQSSGTPFHEEIKRFELTDWQFSLLEQVQIPDDVRDVKNFIDGRERHWIGVFDSINNGYNTMTVNTKEESLSDISVVKEV